MRVLQISALSFRIRHLAGACSHLPRQEKITIVKDDPCSDHPVETFVTKVFSDVGDLLEASGIRDIRCRTDPALLEYAPADGNSTAIVVRRTPAEVSVVTYRLGQEVRRDTFDYAERPSLVYEKVEEHVAELVRNVDGHFPLSELRRVMAGHRPDPDIA